MKKKIFFQLHPVLLFLVDGFVLVEIVAWVIILLIDPFLNTLKLDGFMNIITVGIYHLAILVLIWYLIISNYHWICFKENCIYVPRDLRRKTNRRQHKIELKYEDIQDITFERSIKSSTNKKIYDETLRPFYHQYLVLVLKSGKKERIFIYYYTKRQKIKILQELNKRIEDLGNKINFSQAKKSLDELGMFGVKFIIDIGEKHKKKKD